MCFGLIPLVSSVRCEIYDCLVVSFWDGIFVLECRDNEVKHTRLV